jgi:hypothetical protein
VSVNSLCCCLILLLRTKNMSRPEARERSMASQCRPHTCWRYCCEGITTRGLALCFLEADIDQELASKELPNSLGPIEHCEKRA